MDATRFRILMVDDVTRYHTLYEMAITDALPAKVHFATNGEEALDKLKSPVPFDLLILDLNMPKLGGEETLKRIRQDPTYDNMPVIILTGDPDQDTHRRLLELGADDFVEKGAQPEVFVARLKAQMRHKMALDRLSQVAVDMDIFAAGVLHDIRNLETTILTVCELTREYLTEDPVAMQGQILQDFTALETKADGLGRYASEIITMVRETRKPLELKPQPLKPLLEWVMKMAQGQDVVLTYEIKGELEPVVADKHFLQLALLNLVQNSVKYRRKEVPPHVIVRQRPSAAAAVGGNPGVVTCLTDNGIGIKKTELRKVFEPFVRGRDQAGEKGGFGLGLMLVSKVMSTMGGRVWAEQPAAGLGTTMCLELPTAARGGPA